MTVPRSLLLGPVLAMSTRPPIFVEEHGALMIFSTTTDAETWVEAVDVPNDEYRFYDSRGLVLPRAPG